MRIFGFMGIVALCITPTASYGNNNFVFSNQKNQQVISGIAVEVPPPVPPPVNNNSPPPAQAPYGAMNAPPPYSAASTQQNNGQHIMPPTPPGWDSLTTGETNGGGVLDSIATMNGLAPFPPDMEYQMGNGGFLPPGLEQGMAMPYSGYRNDSQGYSRTAAQREYDRQMYAAFQAFMQQSGYNRPGPSYGGGYTGAYPPQNYYGNMPPYGYR